MGIILVWQNNSRKMLKITLLSCSGAGINPSLKITKLNSKVTTANFRVEDKAKGIYWAIYLELTSQIRKKKHYKQIL